MAQIPDFLPQPTRDNWQRTLLAERLPTKMDDGFLHESRKTKSVPQVFSLAWLLDWNQFAKFEAWFVYGLKNGTELFSVTIAGETFEVKCLAGNYDTRYDESNGSWSVVMQVMHRQTNANPVIVGMVEYPANFPPFERGGYEIGFNNTGIVSDIETGPPESRNRFQNRATNYKGNIFATLAERNQFWTFYRETLKNGLSWFMAPFANGVGLVRVRAKIVSHPVEVPEGAQFRITFDLITGSMPKLTRAQYEAL